jgi:WD40 repeat protein
MQGLLRLWDTEKNRPPTAVSRVGHVGAITAVAQHAPTGLLASGGEDGVVNLWQRTDGKFLRSVGSQGGAVTGVAFASDGRLVFSAAGDGTVLARRVLDGKVVWRFPQVGTGPAARCLALGGDGRRVAVGYDLGRLAVLSAADGQVLTENRADSADVTALAFSPDGAAIARGGSTGQVRVYRVGNDLAPVSDWKLDSPVRALCFVPTGRYLFVGGQHVTLHDVRSGRLEWRVEQRRGPVRALRLNPGTKDLLVVDQGDRVSVLSIGTWLTRLRELGLGIDGVWPE